MAIVKSPLPITVPSDRPGRLTDLLSIGTLLRDVTIALAGIFKVIEWHEDEFIESSGTLIPHKLGRVPRGVVVYSTDSNRVVYQNRNQWTREVVHLQTGAGTATVNFILFLLLACFSLPAGFPSRDKFGSTNGEGVKIALYALTALGNAAAISNTTISYTDESGNAGATGTFQAAVGYQAPATPVIGTFMPFTLAAGDRGVRTLASITLATTYTSGTMSLIAYRPILTIGTSVVNVPATIPIPAHGIRVYPGSCFAFVNVGSATLALANASFTVVERP